MGDRRIAANPHANGGKLLRDLRTPDFKDYAVDIPFPGSVEKQDMIELGGYIRDVLKLNADAKNFRIFGPDETMSNRLYKCFEATDRDWNSTIVPGDEFLARDGRIMDSMLSEHLCEGWLEGYLLTGRHGFFCQLRELYPRRRFHGRAARQVAQSLQPAALAAEHRQPQPGAVQ